MRIVKIIGLIVAILALITAIVALSTEVIKLKRELPPEAPTTIFAPTIISPTNEEPATAESTNWSFALEKRFPAGFWSAGTHSYSFAFACPNEAPDSVTRDFTVSNSFPAISGDVYLRWSALRVGNPWGEIVDGINPSQSTIASVAWDTITKSEADWRTSNCTGTISWDGGAIESLTGTPFQR